MQTFREYHHLTINLTTLYCPTSHRRSVTPPYPAMPPDSPYEEALACMPDTSYYPPVPVIDGIKVYVVYEASQR